MKKLFLCCNAHLDEGWMWDEDEGISSVLSTYYSASKLLTEYDFVFNHNESLLYETVEKLDPPLFQAIQQQVQEGKWHIVGGEFVQPDCLVPSGEAMVRQVMIGRNYVKEKFDVEPKTLWNVDSFGHSRGMVQILKKCGIDNYLFCRPMPDLMTLPNKIFLWKGLDDSEIKATRFEDIDLYCNALGNARVEIERKAKNYENDDYGIALWGVGNHGGGPSRKDLGDIKELQKVTPYEIVHGTPDDYFATQDPKDVWDKDLYPVFVKALSSMSRIKQKHSELEHALFETEKICSVASLKGWDGYNKESFLKAEKALANMEFHDVLSGTASKDSEKTFGSMADGSLADLYWLRHEAMIYLTKDELPAEEGSYPTFVFNPNPRPFKGVLESEFLILQSMVTEQEFYEVEVKANGKVLPSQVVKEHSDINYDRRKRIATEVEIPALGYLRLDMVPIIKPLVEKTEPDIVFDFGDRHLAFNKKTGMLESYQINGKEYLSGPAFEPSMFEDNADPWGWWMDSVGKNFTKAKLSSCDHGPFIGRKPIKVVEDGPIYAEVETLLEVGSSFLAINYKLYKDHPYIDISVKSYWNEFLRGLRFSMHGKKSDSWIGQSMFGYEYYPQEGNEHPSGRYGALPINEKESLVLFNDFISGASVKDGVLSLTALNGSNYVAHPIGDRPLLKEDRFHEPIEMGSHEFHFRLGVFKNEDLETMATEFLEKPYPLQHFPHGEKALAPLQFHLDNEKITLVAFKQSDISGDYVLRLLNGTENQQDCQLQFEGQTIVLHFGKFEVKTLVYDGKTLKEAPRLLI